MSRTLILNTLTQVRQRRLHPGNRFRGITRHHVVLTVQVKAGLKGTDKPPWHENIRSHQYRVPGYRTALIMADHNRLRFAQGTNTTHTSPTK